MFWTMLWFRRINLAAVMLCFIVVVFGAYVRLNNAGLGCPDWPGCYGQVGVPQLQHEVAAAEQNYQRPVEAPKAWKEMIHRYLVSLLSVAIIALAILAAWDRGRRLPLRLVLGVIGVIAVQIVFGALTVTMKVNPLIVTTHLLLGLSTLALLWWIWLRGILPVSREEGRVRAPRNEREAWKLLDGTPVRAETAEPTQALRRFAKLALLLLVVQIFLGGWTSTNYAALACPDFPACHGSLWPAAADFRSGFTLWHGSERNYEFGILDNSGRMAIHLTHRYGAAVIATVVGALALYLLMQGTGWRRYGFALMGALILQISLGIATVVLQFPLLLADAHNAGAAVLLLTLLTINFHARNFQPVPT